VDEVIIGHGKTGANGRMVGMVGMVGMVVDGRDGSGGGTWRNVLARGEELTRCSGPDNLTKFKSARGSYITARQLTSLGSDDRDWPHSLSNVRVGDHHR
jgi:hypothetical protein